MKNITQFNNPVCNEFRKAFQAELNEVAKRFGLTAITIESECKFSNTTFQMKVTARTIAQAEDPNFLRIQKSLLFQLGLPDNSIGRQFVSQGKTFQITRIDAKKMENASYCNRMFCWKTNWKKFQIYC
jgi:hypothetical protein